MMMMVGAKRILVADDSDTSRTVLTRYLSAQRNIDVCGEAVNGEEAIEKAWEWGARHPPYSPPMSVTLQRPRALINKVKTV